MRTKKVSRYWCDFCNKAGLSAGSMAKHEKHCTMNPARNCRVCTLIDGGYGPGEEGMRELLAILPANVDFEADWNGNPTKRYKEFCQALDTAMPLLRTATENCPACILAAFRQAKIPVPLAPGFDFSAEMKTVFNTYNELRNEEQYY